MTIFANFLRLLAVLAFLLPLTAAQAQDAEEKSTLIKFVEDKLSAPNRQIRLNGLRGALSSSLALDSITIADERGVWLRIVEPKLEWNRSALLRGRLEIESLTASKIDYPRNATPDESAPSPEAVSFQLPELPVAIVLEKLAIEEVDIGEPVFGLAARIALNGRIVLDDGELEADLAVTRLDAEGSLTAKAVYGGEPANLDIAVRLEEPADGVLANLLNLPGDPAVALVIAGKGPVDDLDTTLAFDVDGNRILDGRLALDRRGDVLQARARLTGPLSRIMPPDQRAFFGDSSRLEADLAFQGDGSVTLPRILIDSGAVQMTANAATMPDGFLELLNLDLRVRPIEGQKVSLPGSGDKVTLAAARLDVMYDARSDGSWQATLDADNVTTSSATIASVSLKGTGTISDPQDPQTRRVTFNVDGDASGVAPTDADVATALGDTLDFTAAGFWKAGDPVTLEQMALSAQSAQITAAGTLTADTFDGTIALDSTRLASFAGLLERPLGGSARLAAKGKIFPVSGGFNLVFDGVARQLQIGDSRLDALLTGETKLAGGIARSENGLTFSGFQLKNNQLIALIDGNLKSESANLSTMVRLTDLGILVEESSGPVEVTARLSGDEQPFDTVARLAMPSGRLAGKNVEDLKITFEGKANQESAQGELGSDGFIAGEAVTLSGTIDVSASRQRVENLAARIGGTQLSGTFERHQDGLIDARLDIDSRDISAAAALALIDASGAIRGNVELSADDAKRQSGQVDVVARNLRYGQYRVGQADIDAAFQELFGTPAIDAQIEATDAAIAGLDIRRMEAKASSSGETTDFDLRATLRQNEAKIAAEGRAIQSPDETRIELSALTVDSSIADARLTQPTTLVLRDGTVTVSDTRLAVGGGSVTVTGSAGKQLDLDIALNSLPLAIANTFRPGLQAQGTLSGTANVTGTASDPRAIFDLNGSGLSAAPLSDQGIAPVNLSANGRYGGGAVELASATVRNGQGIEARASGRIPLSGGGLSLSVNGTAPLAIARPLIASRGATIAGTAQVNARVTGSLSDPSFNGQLSVSGAQFTDPLSNLRLTGISLTAGLDGDRVTVRTAQANLASGGSVTASGTVLLDAGLTADLSIQLNGARYTDGETFLTRASGRLRLSGPLAFDPLLSGNIVLERTEIAVPESFAGSSDLLDVTHIRPSPPVRRTLERLQRVTPSGRPNSRPSVLRLDLTVSAPNQIFVRGRGLDAELGGQLRITGPVTDVQPVGAFNLRRGRLSIVGQRIELEEGTIRLTGNLDPYLRFVARTRSDTVEAIITIEGRVSDLEVTFSSVPELPEDEVLAQLIFGRSISDLSAVQIAKLASIAAELTGGNSPGLVDGLRRGTGLDDLDVVTDNEGNAAVRAGKYVNDNVYLGVEAGSETKATINLDITDNITARGGVTSEGNSSIGIFLERDY